MADQHFQIQGLVLFKEVPYLNTLLNIDFFAELIEVAKPDLGADGEFTIELLVILAFPNKFQPFGQIDIWLQPKLRH